MRDDAAPSRRILLAFIVLFGFAARASTYKSPLLDHHAWRQADTASISRNFARDRFNVLYPQIDSRGSRAEGYVETGLELFAFMVAAVSSSDRFRPEIGRLSSAVLFIGSCLLVWSFVKHRYGERHALVAAFLYAFAFPLGMYIERAFMNEALLIFLSLACLRGAQRYLDTRSAWDLMLLVAASSLIAMVKLPYLIIWAPIAGLFLERHGVAETARRWELWLLVVVNLGFAGAWYAHAHRLAATTGLSFGLTDKLFDPALVFSSEFVLKLLDRLVRDILEPIGLLGVAVGAWVSARKRRWCEILGLGGVAAYLVIVAVGNYHHDYYQLTMMPLAPVLASVGLVSVSERFSKGSNHRRDVVLACLLGAAAAATLVRSASAHSWYEYSPHDVETCQSIRDISDPGELVVFVGDNNPQMLFCIDRKGWLLAAHEVDRPTVEHAWKQGARLAVVPRALGHDEVRAFLAATGREVYAGRAVTVFRLP